MNSNKPAAAKPIVLMVINNPAFFLSHRLNIALHAREQGYEIQVATMAGDAAERIQALGFKHYVIPMSRSGMNPLQESKTVAALYRLFKKVRPDVVHLVTIKSVLYGGAAARLAKVPAVLYAISGMGYLFTDREKGFNPTALITSFLYKRALGHPNFKVIVQNRNDEEILQKIAGLNPRDTVLIRGSGADLSVYKAAPEPPEPPVIVSMAARLLKDKGVMEYAKAAELSAQRGLPVRWQLAGTLDPGNPSSLSEAELRDISQHVSYVGEQKNIAEFYAQSHVAVLPSYREGLPKSLVEAAACQRAVVTTDVPGCRDAIIPNETGLLVPVRDAQALLAAVEKLAADPALRQELAAKGRRLAEQEFDDRKIAARQVALYGELLARAGR